MYGDHVAFEILFFTILDLSIILFYETTVFDRVFAVRGIYMTKKLLRTFFCAVFLCAALLFLWINQTPELSNRSTIPDDIESRQYALSSITQDEGGYTFQLHSPEKKEVALVLSNAEATRILLNDEIVFQNDLQSQYNRVRVVPLEISGEVQIAIRSNSWDATSKEVLSNTTSTQPHVILGGKATVERANRWYLAINMVCIGMYLFMAINSVVLYSCKRSEKYLLHLALVSVGTMVLALVNSNVCFIPMSNQLHSQIRPVIAFLPVMLNIGLCFSLLRKYIPAWIQPFCNSAALLVSTALLIILDAVFKLNFHYLVVFAMTLTVLQTIYGAMKCEEEDAILLLVGYGAGIGTIIEVMCYHAGLLYETNVLNTYVSVVQLNYFLNLICCSIIIGRRFSRKFRDAEKLAAELGEMNMHLEEIVEERTSSLRDEQDRKHNMMMNIFHDLRSPVFVLEGRLSDFQPQTKEETEALNVMRSRVSYLHRLIEDLFLTAKLESGSVIFDERDVDLKRVLENVLRVQQTSAREKQVTLSLNAIENVFVWGDPQRLEQVFQNLIENALHHTPEGADVQLVMRLEEENVCVDVKDSGMGIAQEDIPRIFDRYFYRKKKGSRSSGLGLSIAKEIVAVHQGCLSVESEIGKGATFTVSLPRCVE